MNHLATNFYEAASVILFGIGFMNLLLQNNLIKKFIGLNIMDINPVPAGLVLTGIVVSVSVTAFSLALVQRLYKHYGTLNMDEIMKLSREEEGE